jgi:hypothetical protein
MKDVNILCGKMQNFYVKTGGTYIFFKKICLPTHYVLQAYRIQKRGVVSTGGPVKLVTLFSRWLKYVLCKTFSNSE